MPGPKSPPVILTETERLELETLVRARKTGQQIVFRARIILALANGATTKKAATELKTTRNTIRLWRDHWLTRTPIAAPVPGRLRDDPRPGAPQTFTAEQWCQIIAVACERPDDADKANRPLSHWTPREIRDEVLKREIVSSISVRHVGRFLKSGRVETASKSTVAQPGS